MKTQICKYFVSAINIDILRWFFVLVINLVNEVCWNMCINACQFKTVVAVLVGVLKGNFTTQNMWWGENIWSTLSADENQDSFDVNILVTIFR